MKIAYYPQLGCGKRMPSLLQWSEEVHYTVLARKISCIWKHTTYAEIQVHARELAKSNPQLGCYDEDYVSTWIDTLGDMNCAFSSSLTHTLAKVTFFVFGLPDFLAFLHLLKARTGEWRISRHHLMMHPLFKPSSSCSVWWQTRLKETAEKGGADTCRWSKTLGPAMAGMIPFVSFTMALEQHSRSHPVSAVVWTGTGGHLGAV